MTVLPDTSIWVDYLRHGRRGNAFALDDLLRLGQVVICGPVVAELLAGTQQRDRDELWALFQALPWAPLGRREWRQAGEAAATLRERGMTVPLTDLAIAVSADAADAELWTRDSDFERIATVLPGLRRYPPEIGGK